MNAQASWMGCLVFVAIGCGDDVAVTTDAGDMPDAAQTDAGNTDAGFTGFDGRSLRCGAPVAAPHGFERCETGALRRVSPSTCPSSVPRATAIPGNFPGVDECDHESDCADLRLGHCAQREGGAANTCVAGCMSDDDCADGRVCLCDEPVGRCIPAECRGNADCDPGFDCVLFDSPDACLPRRLACQTPDDQCAGSVGCGGYSVNPTFCVRTADGSSCSIVQCTQP